MPYRWRDLSQTNEELKRYEGCKCVISLALGRGSQPAYWIDVYKNKATNMPHPMWHVARQWSFVKKDKATGKEETIEGEYLTKNLQNAGTCADLLSEYTKKKTAQQWKIVGMKPSQATDPEDAVLFTKASSIQWEGINRSIDPNPMFPQTAKTIRIAKAKRFKDLQLKRQAKAKW
jgi:hypothetical protein